MLDIWVSELPTEFPYHYKPMGRVVLKPGEEVTIYSFMTKKTMRAWVTDKKEKGHDDGVWWYWISNKPVQYPMF